MSISRSTSSPTSTQAATTTPQPTPISPPEAIRQVTPIEDVLPGQFQQLYASPDGALWLVTDKGVAVRRDEGWRAYLDDLSGEMVGIDPDGRVWVMSEDTAQIRAWDGSSWTVYGAETGWQPLVLEDEWYREIGWVQPDEQGRLWLATSQDVRMLHGERWTVFTPADMDMEPFDPHVLWATFALEVAESTDTVWIGECDWGGPGPVGGQGVRWFDGQAWHGADSPVPGGCATFIEEDRQGRVWIGVEENVWRYDAMSGGWSRFVPPDPPIADMRFGFVHALALDPHDDAWPALVLCGGASCFGRIALYRIEDDVWTQIGDTADFGGGLPAHKLVPDGADAYWLFWVGSLYRVVGETAELVYGLGPVYHTVVDASGRVWFAAWYDGRDWLWTLDVRA